MTLSYDFGGAVAAVTGAGGGIGRAVAEGFGRAGAVVYLLDIDEQAGTEAAGRITAGRFLACDVRDPENVAGTFAHIGAEEGRLDILVNNAGGFPVQRTTEELSVDEWRKVLDLNLTGAFLVTQTALPLLRRSSRGRIVNLGSLAGQTAGYRTSPAYAAAKAGLHAFTRVLAHELAGDGITVNALAPSAVMTDRITRLRDADERAETARSIPLGRYQSAAEVAEWILFLASEEAGYATGQIVSVNGGRFMA